MVAADGDEASETRLAAASLLLVRDHPYLAAALWSVKRIKNTRVTMVAVDGRWRLHYNPGAIEEWDVDTLCGVLYHELCHLLRDHSARAAAVADKRLWNLCADAEINDDIRAEGIVLPEGAVYPSTFGLPAGLLAEEYYNLLVEPRRDIPGPASGFGDSGPGVCSGDCGSGVTGDAGHYETSGDAMADGVSEAEAEIIRHQVAKHIQQLARDRGDVPGGWRRWADATVQPQADWRRELASLLRRAVGSASGCVDYSYSYPSRRQHCAGNVVIPSLRQPVPEVAVIVDTSGSIASAQLQAALSEIRGILESIGHRRGVTVLAVDAAVHWCGRVVRVDEVMLLGGGGTDMTAGLNEVWRLRQRPDVVVVITDGRTPWPSRPLPGMATLVALLGDGPDPPAWTRTVRIDC